MSEDNVLVRVLGPDRKPWAGRPLRVELHRPLVKPAVFPTTTGEVAVPRRLVSDDLREAGTDAAGRARHALPHAARAYVHAAVRSPSDVDARSPHSREGQTAAEGLPEGFESSAHAFVDKWHGGGDGALAAHPARTRWWIEVWEDLPGGRKLAHADLIAPKRGLPPRQTQGGRRRGGPDSRLVRLARLRPRGGGGGATGTGAQPAPQAGATADALVVVASADAYWSFRFEGVRRAPIGPLDRMVHRSADTGILDGSPAAARAPGWRLAFGLATARGAQLARPVTLSRCGLVQAGRDQLLSLLTGPPSADGSWLPAILDWANAVGGPTQEEQIFGEFLPRVQQLARAQPAPPVTVEDITAAATRSWSARGVLPATAGDPSDAALVDRLINGMSPHGLARGADPATGADRWIWVRTFDRGPDAPPANYVQPDVRVILVPAAATPTKPWRTAGLPTLQAIALRYPGGAWQTVQPSGAAAGAADLDPWSHAKRCVRQALLVSGQIDWHVARCHFATELLLVAMRQELRPEEPLHQALWPFLRSADEINEFGEELLFSPLGLLGQATGLAYSAVDARVRAHLAAALTAAPAPRKPLCPEDRFALWAKLTRAATHRWAQYSLPDSVLTNETRRRLAAAVTSGLPTAAGTGPAWRGGSAPGALEKGERWLDRACAPTPKALPADAEGWRRLLVHAVWSATFLHSWVGRAQWTDGGSPLLAPLGTRWTGAPAASGTAEWASGGPLPAHAGLQCALAEVLVAPRWGMLADGETTDQGGHPVEYEALRAQIQA
ncbi:MAG: hypothetical protein RL071_1608, partial [Pseudomonadota bacterium]